MSYPEGLGCWGVREVKPGRVWSLGSFFSFGVGKAWLWAELAQGGMPGRQGSECFLLSHFPSPSSSRWGLQSRLFPPLLPPVHAHAWLALAPSCPHTCLRSPLLPARAPHAVAASPRACLAGWLWCGLWAELGVLLPSLSLQQHSHHQVRGLVPELCQPLQPCLCSGTPGIQGLVLGAPLHPQSGQRARHCPSTWVTLLPAAMSRGWKRHRPPSHLARPAKGSGPPLPKPPRWVQAGWEPCGSSLQPGVLSSSCPPSVYQTSVIS